MRREDREALRWVEVTIRRAGRQAAARYGRYAQEILRDPIDIDVLAPLADAATDGDREMILDVRRAFAELSTDERRVLFLTAVADWPQRRVAETLHFAQSRVSQLRLRALLRMRVMLEGRERSDD